MTAALIMAGGRSARMRASGDQRHKALRQVCGRSLLERNVRLAIRGGVDQVFVATSSEETSLQEFVRTEMSELGASCACRVECLIEGQPLGTVGVARDLARLECDVLVLNVDNLTDLDMSLPIHQHRSTGAPMTIATHLEPFQVPLGQVICEGGEIVQYLEKPQLPVLISSGAYVLSSRVCAWIEPNRRTDIPELIPLVQSHGERVMSFEHGSLWIDINDAETLARAERLVSENQAAFEYDLACRPIRHERVAHHPRRKLVRERSDV